MIVVYAGDGKGKTSAAMGQIIRAMGHGMRVGCVQFMKRNGVAGEQYFLANLLGEDYHIGGLGFFKNQEEFDLHRESALAALHWAAERIKANIQLLVMDESLYALGAGLIVREELQEVLDAAQVHGVHVVLTGRGLPDWLLGQADLVTEMVSRKHPYGQGQGAVRGVEY
jgi:cob(I)alamin adenosyltransferase